MCLGKRAKLAVGASVRMKCRPNGTEGNRENYPGKNKTPKVLKTRNEKRHSGEFFWRWKVGKNCVILHINSGGPSKVSTTERWDYCYVCDCIYNFFCLANNDVLNLPHLTLTCKGWFNLQCFFFLFLGVAKDENVSLQLACT